MTFIKKFLGLCVIFLLSSTLISCATSSVSYDKMTDEQIYHLAMTRYNAKDYKGAEDAFLQIEQQYPYSSLVADSLLMSGLTAYKNKSYVEAEAFLSRFIDLYPSNKKEDYAYFLKVQIYYDQMLGVGHDQSMALKAYDAIHDLENRYPQSLYIPIIQEQMGIVIEHLAGDNMETGRFYEKRRDYIAAIDRFQFVILSYEHSKQVPEALYRLVECYVALGLDDTALYTVSALGYGYPDNIWYKRALSFVHKYGISK